MYYLCIHLDHLHAFLKQLCIQSTTNKHNHPSCPSQCVSVTKIYVYISAVFISHPHVSQCVSVTIIYIKTSIVVEAVTHRSHNVSL